MLVRKCSPRGLCSAMHPDVLAPLLNASEFAYAHRNGERHIFDCTNGFYRANNEELATTGVMFLIIFTACLTTP
jgi:hypothetical protein